ncbi:adenosine deaminase, partial [Pseudomonas sp. GW460-12]
TERGISYETVFDVILEGMAEAARTLGVTSSLIMCFQRHLDEASALAVLERSKRWHDRLLGVGLDSSELGHPPSKFARVFA